LQVPYGQLPIFSPGRSCRDVVFPCERQTTSGVRVPNGELDSGLIRRGLNDLRPTSAIFGRCGCRWDKLDGRHLVVAEIAGGEGGHGVLGCRRAPSSGSKATPRLAAPEALFRLTFQGQAVEGVFRAETMQTRRRVLCVEMRFEFTEMGRNRSAVSTG